MWYIFLIIISILPVYILGNKIYKNDYEKEPKKLLISLFLFGVLSVAVTLILTFVLTAIFPFFALENLEELNIITLIVYVFIGVALIEEFSKWIFAYKGTYNHIEFNHAYDAIVYSVFVSLGFACVENCLYVITSATSVQTAIMRGISAVPAHVSFGIFMGYFIALAKIAEKNNNIKISKKNKILSLAIPVIFHGAYDYLIYATMFNGIIIFIFIMFVIFMFKNGIKKVKQLANISYNLGGQAINQAMLSPTRFGYNFCPVCGDRVRGNFCRVCGHRHNINNVNLNY